MTRCVRWGVKDPHRKGRFGGRTPSQNMELSIGFYISQIVSPMLPPGEYKRGVSDSALYQITLVAVQFAVSFHGE